MFIRSDLTIYGFYVSRFLPFACFHVSLRLEWILREFFFVYRLIPSHVLIDT